MISGSTPVRRELLGTFIVQAVDGEIEPSDWHRFMVAHYSDETMQRIGCQCVDLIEAQCKGNAALLTSEEIKQLRDAAAALT